MLKGWQKLRRRRASCGELQRWTAEGNASPTTAQQRAGARRAQQQRDQQKRQQLQQQRAQQQRDQQQPAAASTTQTNTVTRVVTEVKLEKQIAYDSDGNETIEYREVTVHKTEVVPQQETKTETATTTPSPRAAQAKATAAGVDPSDMLKVG